MAKDKEDIKVILDDYRRFHKVELSSSKLTKQKFQTIYDEFMGSRNDTLSSMPHGYLYFIHRLNKLAKAKKYYCGVDMAEFAKKIKLKHSYNDPFHINLLKKDSEGRFVMKKKTKEGCQLVPVEHSLLSVFTAFVQYYIDSELFDNIFDSIHEF